MEPATSIIKDLGGAPNVAAICGVHPTRVWSWMRSKRAGGTDGRIPQSHHLAILRAAREQGKDITAESLLPRSDSSDPEAA